MSQLWFFLGYVFCKNNTWVILKQVISQVLGRISHYSSKIGLFWLLVQNFKLNYKSSHSKAAILNQCIFSIRYKNTLMTNIPSIYSYSFNNMFYQYDWNLFKFLWSKVYCWAVRSHSISICVKVLVIRAGCHPASSATLYPSNRW